MAPAFRNPRQVEPMATVNEDRDDDNYDQQLQSEQETRNIWDRRKRRLAAKKDRRRRSKSTDTTRSAENDNDDDLDPYESDPGESYRDHCLKFQLNNNNNGIGNRTCLALPKFLRKQQPNEQQQPRQATPSTVLTAPPSPLQSELGDLLHTPASLPPTSSRVRYSLRSSITDGSEKQPMGPSMMERRELRPNGIHLNVSHWTDEGGRPYMEDRYVFGLM